MVKAFNVADKKTAHKGPQSNARSYMNSLVVGTRIAADSLAKSA